LLIRRSSLSAFQFRTDNKAQSLFSSRDCQYTVVVILFTAKSIYKNQLRHEEHSPRKPARCPQGEIILHSISTISCLTFQGLRSRTHPPTRLRCYQIYSCLGYHGCAFRLIFATGEDCVQKTLSMYNTVSTLQARRARQGSPMKATYPGRAGSKTPHSISRQQKRWNITSWISTILTPSAITQTTWRNLEMGIQRGPIHSSHLRRKAKSSPCLVHIHRNVRSNLQTGNWN
jgi:hypothetical protein